MSSSSLRVSLGALALATLAVSCTAGGPPDETVTFRSALNSDVIVTVRDAVGVAISGMGVAALRPNGSQASYAVTNASGLVTFSLPANTYHFDAYTSNTDFVSANCQTPSCTAATITIPYVDVTVVATNGAPLANHVINWETPQGATGAWSPTNASGQIHMAVPPGSYRFVDNVNNFDFTSGAAGHCTVPSCTAATITETLPVTVTVTNSTGAPQSGVTVIWFEAQGAGGGWLPTDANGHVTLSVPPGSLTFEVPYDNGGFDSTPACVVPGCTSASIVMSNPVVVTVTDTAGTPMSGKSVVWEAVGGAVGAGTNTNASGQVTLLPPLAPVRFRVVVDGTTFYSGAAGHCTQPACTTAAISVSQPSVVTVVDGSGNPISGRAVTPVSTEGITAGNKNTNASGQATFRLPFAHWQFKAKCTGNNETFFSGNAGHCYIPGGCLTAMIKMPCGQCAGKVNGFGCDDQNPCTASSNCQSQFCTGSAPMSCSASDSCHDAGACGALPGTCSNPAKPVNTACTDGNVCNGAELCNAAGSCQPGPGGPPTVDDGNPCTADACDPVTGVSHTAVANGTICDDHDTCTQFDVCQAGVCHGPTPYVCKTPGQCREVGTCSSTATTSSTPPAMSDLVAWYHLDGDGHDATGNGHDLTVEGSATPSPGRFGKAMTFDGTSCMTAPSWTAADLVGAPGVTMMAWVNHATAYTCPYPYTSRVIMGKGLDYSMGSWCGGEPGQGFHPGIALGLRPEGWQTWGYGGPAGIIPGPGDWALVTIIWDTHGIAEYVNGRMVGGYNVEGHVGNLFRNFAVGCYVDDEQHGNARSKNYLGSIDEVLLYKRALSTQEIVDYYAATDPCAHANKAEGTFCYDNNACTQADACHSGECVGANPVTCTGDQCRDAGTCNPATGVCSNTDKPDGTACNDSNACTQTDSCQDGACAGENEVVCAAPDSCHQAGTCNPASGICSAPGPLTGPSCDDGNRCSVADACGAGTCLPGPATGCSDAGAAHYVSVVDLGATQGFPFARGINNLGDVVGTETVPTSGLYEHPIPGNRAFRWSESEGLVYLPPAPGQVTSYGVDINDAGVISGTLGLDGVSTRAYRYDPHTNPSPQYQPVAGFGRGINASGTMAGGSYFSAGLRMFRISTGAAEELPSILDPDPTFMQAWANDIAADGTLIGAHVTTGLGRRAIRYSASRGTEALNDLLPANSGWYLQEAHGINQQTIVGWGRHDGLGRAFRLTVTPTGDFASIVDLGLPASYDANASNIVIAHKSNASGEVVGGVYDQSAFWPETAFVHTTTTGLVALGSLVDPDSDWDLRVVYDINDNHQVVGFGYRDGQPRAFRLTLPDLSPCPPPAMAATSSKERATR